MNSPDILNKTITENSATIALFIDPSLDGFKGHFDTFSVIPGVVQVQWVLHFFSDELAPLLPLNQSWLVEKLSALKFQHVILPEQTIQLDLHYNSQKHCLSFKFYDSQHPFSSGKIFFSS